ncbi:hypothetical protein SAMN04487969_102502 [Paenibacillus algorifonticola]|uniref:Phage neck terminator protein gp12-like domain-containing protein n=1 Tax=Paenibacillus algorifonticola TaxID=684063 RepID=A0A1I2AHP8_9BACL|nr:hypothetical protein [Paenibacillus algorifonticola]SFE43525.1 hypothetical protein SAMN04487969_102502 [Paenibacillus algorifonticola]
MLTLNQITDMFYALTMTLLGFDPDDPTKQDRVRTAWPAVGAPAWERTDDVCFMQVTLSPDQYTQQIESTYSPQGLLIQSFTEVAAVSWIFYGPSSFDDSRKIRAGLFKPSTFETLSLQDTYLVTDVPEPVRSPELFNGQWWDRSNLFARFNIKTEIKEAIPHLETADIVVIPNR